MATVTTSNANRLQEACLFFWDCDLKGLLVSNCRRLDGRKSQRLRDPAQAWFVSHVIEGAVDSDFQDEFVVSIVCGLDVPHRSLPIPSSCAGLRQHIGGKLSFP